MSVLPRGLNDKAEEIRRTRCQIVDNMCKVVGDPGEIQPLMGKLEPLAKTTVEKMSDPEARTAAERTYKTLQKAAEGPIDKVTWKQEDAMKVSKKHLGDKAEGEEAFYAAGLAATVTNEQRECSAVPLHHPCDSCPDQSVEKLPTSILFLACLVASRSCSVLCHQLEAGEWIVLKAACRFCKNELPAFSLPSASPVLMSGGTLEDPEAGKAASREEVRRATEISSTACQQCRTAPRRLEKSL